MTDIHCHILPGVDDGARDERESCKMLEQALREGIAVIVATPHYEYGTDNSDAARKQEAFGRLRRLIKERNLPCELYLGSELFYSDSVIAALKEGLAFTINRTKYVLVEFPLYEQYPYIEKAVRNLRYAGYIPILAHVERYYGLYKTKYIEELIEIGAYIQVNAGTVLGKHGRREQWFIRKLMNKRLVHFIATDAHSGGSRRPQMKQCLQVLKDKYGTEYCRILTEINPEKLLKGEQINGKSGTR